jgi:PiT family inorganic phosphate transporter
MPNYLLFAFGENALFSGSETQMVIAILAIALALGFDFVNGFHDTANACATVIYTKALKPTPAIIGAGLLNFLGAVLVGTAVAQVITKIIPADKITLTIVVAVLIASLIWNLFTWWVSLPVSSSHCLIGSLFGAGLMAAGAQGVAWPELTKVFTALILSPFCGFIAGCALTWVGIKLSGKPDRRLASSVVAVPSPELIPAGMSSTDNYQYGSEKMKTLNTSEILSLTHPKQPLLMRSLHIFASGLVAFSHGSNDGQKTMGIITLILATQFANHGYTINHVPFWVILACASAIGLGTTIGGWRIIKTVGEKIGKEPITHAQGFGASLGTALVILIASRIGAPISTTHTLSSAVAGGIIPAHGPSKFNSSTLKTIALAWVLTVPITAALAAGCYAVLRIIIGQ